MADQIDRILNPSSVAIVGASTDPTKRGYQAIETLQKAGYQGDIYPVNPNYDEIRGLRTYPTISAAPDSIDLALIVTPASVVPSVLEDADSDLAGAVVVAVGFGEADETGEALEEQIVDIAAERNIRLIGPNTSGMINVHAGMNLVGADKVPAGNLALLCQSGNMAISLFTEALADEGTGFSHYVGVGNEADLQFHEYLPYFETDPNTDAVLCYVEGMKDGRRFLQEARQMTPDLPIVVLKSGRTDVGRASASSHTGSMAGDSAVAHAALNQAGVVTVARSDELLSTASALSSLPPAQGENVAILADGGGHATLAADAFTDRGVSIPDLQTETISQLREILPDAASVVNPVDVAGGTDDDQTVFFDCAEVLVNDSNIDALFLTGLFGGYGVRFAEEYAEVEATVARQLVNLVDETETPLVVQSSYATVDSESVEILRNAGIPVLESLDVGVTALTATIDYGTHQMTRNSRSDFILNTGSVSEDKPVRKPPGGSSTVPTKSTDARTVTEPPITETPSKSDPFEQVIQRGESQLTEYESREILASRGAPVTPYELVLSESDAAEVAQEFDEPVALKIVSRDVVHKSDIGGVELDLAGEEAVRTAYQRVIESVTSARPEATIDGVLVTPMREPGIKVIVGGTNDEQFGPVVMVGLGGVFVEVLEDVTFRAAPITESEAKEMLAELKAQPLLEGARGSEPVDEEALIEVLIAVSDLVADTPAIAEVDCNPIFATPEGAEIVDASITLQPAAVNQDAGEQTRGGDDE